MEKRKRTARILGNSRSASQNRFLILFTIPTLLLFGIFVLLPIVQGLYYSFFNWSGLSAKMTFIGLENYKKLFADPIAWSALLNDLKVAVLRLIFTTVLSLALALILTRSKVFANAFFRNVLFFPVMLSVVVIGIIWMMLCNSNFGALNSVLGLIGIKPPAAGWFGDSKTALLSIVPPAVWCSVGFYMIIFISAIESIPSDLFESATLDGASGWKQTVHIILPLIKPQINFCVIYNTINSMNGSYLFVDLLTNGGPNNASQVLGTYMSLNGFKYHQFGYATTIAMLILGATLLMSLILNRVFKSEAYEF